MSKTPITAGLQTEVTASSSARAPVPDRLRQGDLVGRYVILSRLGAGGMGVVHVAYDPELDRRVALKLLHQRKLSPDPAAERRALLREAQAMARLRHPAVITVHDVGEHEGRVFLAMEYVEGVTLREWLRARERPWRRVLEVFVRAGRGLAAAHAEGLIHRDFKPDNVIVSVGQDPDGPVERVGVMDFGLARAFGESSRHGSDLGAGIRPSVDALDENVTMGAKGTPAYMAPEVTHGEEVDARADQFSFCVALWEGLYGERPFPGENLMQLAVAQLSGKIRPPRRRRVPARIHRALLEGLAPSPEDRYPSMAALLAELERDPTRRRVVACAAFVAVAATAGIFGAAELDRRRARATCVSEGARISEIWNDESREKVHAGLSQAHDQVGEATAQRVVPRLDAYAQAWKEARTHACIAATLERRVDPRLAFAVDGCLEESRAAFAGLVDLLAEPTAEVLWSAALSASDLPPLSQCADETWLRQRTPPADDPMKAQQARLIREELHRHAALLAAAPADAAQRLTEIVAKAEALAWPPLLAEARRFHGRAHEKAGNYEEAEAILLEAFLGATGCGADTTAAKAAVGLATVVGYRLGRSGEGLVWTRIAETLLQRLNQSDSHLAAQSLGTQALILYEYGRYDEALERVDRARGLWERIAGPDHIEVARARTNLGLVLQALGRQEEAAEAFRSALEVWESVVGPQHPEVGLLLNNLGTSLLGREKLDEAQHHFERALEVRARTIGTKHPAYASTLSNLGVVAQRRGDLDASRGLYEEALEILTRAVGPDHVRVAQLQVNVALVLSERGEYDRAEAYLHRSLRTFESLDAGHPLVPSALVNLANVARARGDSEEAKEILARVIEVADESHDETRLNVGIALRVLGELAVEEGRYADAVPSLERALGIAERAKLEGMEIAVTRYTLALALHRLGRDPGRVVALAEAARTGATPALLEDVEALLRERVRRP